MKSSSSIIAVLFPFLLITSYTLADDDWMKRSDAPLGTTQFKVALGIDNSAEVQFVVSADGAGLFRSTDGGLTWENIGLAGKSLRSIIDNETNEGEYIVLASNAVYKTTDGGANWQNYTSGLGGLFVTDIVRTDNSGFNSFAVGTVSGGVFNSTDGGETWQQLGTGLENKTVTSIENLNFSGGENGLYVTTQEEGAWWLNSENSTWEPINDGNNNLFGTTAIAGHRNGSLYLASSPRVYTSPRNPVLWQPEIEFDFANDIVVSPDEQVIVSSLGNGIIKKGISPGGWSDFSTGIPEDPDGYKDIGNLAFLDLSFSADHQENTLSQGTGQYLWAAYMPLHPSMTPGIYRTVNPVTAIEEITIDKPTDFNLVQNYPNPFNPATNIRYSVPHLSEVVIKVYDILGTEIETLVNEEKQAGSYQLTWFAEGLPGGVYFYRIQAGSFVQTKKMILLR